MAQLVERSLLMPEVHSSNPVIGKNLFILNICLLSTVYLKDENKEKEPGNGPFLKKILTWHQVGPATIPKLLFFRQKNAFIMYQTVCVPR